MSFLVFILNFCWILSMLGFIIFSCLEYFEATHRFRQEKIELYEECGELSTILMFFFFFLVVVTTLNIK